MESRIAFCGIAAWTCRRHSHRAVSLITIGILQGDIRSPPRRFFYALYAIPLIESSKPISDLMNPTDADVHEMDHRSR